MRAIQECLVIKQEPAQWLANIQIALQVFVKLVDKSKVSEFTQKLYALL